MDNEVKPRLEHMKQDCQQRNLFQPRAAYGYFKCRAENDTLWVQSDADGAWIELTFPRQAHGEQRAIPDFFRPDEDLVGLMVVTLGDAVEQESERLRQDDRYQDYVLFHGFAVEVTDALAEYWHKRMRMEMGVPDPADMTLQGYITQQYRGSRFGFGYPSCPDLRMNEVCCRLVQAQRIGVSLTENWMMAPEVSTSALVSIHPRAKYFYI